MQWMADRKEASNGRNEKISISVMVHLTFVYILHDLSNLLKRDGFSKVSEAVGKLDFKKAMKVCNLNY